MDSLYFLGLLLTGDHEKAEQCFVAGLEDSLKSNQVFAKWAHSWAKRTVIRKAVRLVQPCPLASAIASAEEPSPEAFQSAYFEIGSVLALEDFQRFVFVLSVLEQYSDYECALILGSSGIEVGIARAKAVEEVFHSHANRLRRSTGTSRLRPAFPVQWCANVVQSQKLPNPREHAQFEYRGTNK